MKRGGANKRDESPGPSSSKDTKTKKSSTMEIISEEDSSNVCIFCKSSQIDKVKLGEMYTLEGVTTHYFCMLFSAALSQLGTDDEGILGFLPNDIMKEVRRSHKLKCVYCNITGASVGCCNKKCRLVFHYGCGLDNGANFRFLGNYESYCKEHCNCPKITLKQKDWNCLICMSVVLKDQNPIMSTCCKGAVFHKDCLQRLALSAGYFFKCPACNDKPKFVKEMRCLGIYVPEQDASWERENAFQDLYTQYSNCDAETCECPKGREYVSAKGNWLLARCRLCGASGTHRKCSNLQTIAGWACEPCLTVEKKAEELKNEQMSKETSMEGKPPEENSRTPRVTDPSTSSNTSNEDEENHHVSAVSGNRRVRNGTYRVKQSPTNTKPNLESDDFEDFDLSQVRISKSCISYFPYTETRLIGYKDATVLPDWRQLSLCVNLMKWLPFPSPASFDLDLCRSTSRNVSAKPLRENNSSIIKLPSRSSRQSRNLTKQRTVGRKKRKRGSRWCRGVSDNRSNKLRLSMKISRLRKSTNSGNSKLETKSSSKAETVASQKIPDEDETEEGEVQVIPVTTQEKAESLLLSAIEIEGEKLPPNPTHGARRRKQVFTSDPTRKYYEVKGSILEVDFTTDDNVNGNGEEKLINPPTDEIQLNRSDSSNSHAHFMGQPMKVNVDYDLEFSHDFEQFRIDESETSCSPSKKSRNSNWKPIMKPVSSPKASSSRVNSAAVPSSSAVSNFGRPRRKVVDSYPGSSSESKKSAARTSSQLEESVDVRPSKRVARGEVNRAVNGESNESSSGRTSMDVTSLLHESTRCVEMDHPYSGSLASAIDTKVFEDIKSLQPPEEWSRRAKSWDKDMMNKVLISSILFSGSKTKPINLAHKQLLNES